MSRERTYIDDNKFIKRFLNKEINILLKPITVGRSEGSVSGTLENVDEKYLLVKNKDSYINSSSYKDSKYFIIPHDSIYLIELK